MQLKDISGDNNLESVKNIKRNSFITNDSIK